MSRPGNDGGRSQAAPPGLDAVLAREGWAYASSPPVSADDPGRFHALFGRDSLILALQVLPRRPDVARATLRAHAARIGRHEDPITLEEPGKVIHEWRDAPPPVLVERGWPADERPFASYATTDATAWFLVVLARLGDPALVMELEPAWRAAGGWLERALERGGGLVRHAPGARRAGLLQQGWRDAVDPADPRDGGGGILHRDGRTPAPRLADADTQAVASAALRALTALDPADPGSRSAADALRARIAGAFDPETMAVEPDGTRVRGAGSQLGWLLWADALPPGPARAAADRLCAPDVLTPYGPRTLASSEPHFNAYAYHRGSVWPFDAWLAWGGLRAAGRAREAERVRAGTLDALRRLGDAPELYAVTGDPPAPERVALANRVQTWTIGARLALEAGWDGRPDPSPDAPG